MKNKVEIKRLGLNLSATVNSTYAGQIAGEYFKQAFLTNDTLGGDRISSNYTTFYKDVVPMISVSGALIKGASDTFTDSGVLTKSDNVITAKELQVNTQIAKSVFYSDWATETMGLSSRDRNFPTDYEQDILAAFAGAVGEGTEQMIWNGAGGADAFQGLIPAITAYTNTATSGVNKITFGANQSLTDPTQVVATIQSMITQIPLAIRNSPDFYVYVSPDVWLALETALTNELVTSGLYSATITENRFLGVNFAVVSGMVSGYAVAARRQDLKFAAGLEEDLTSVRILDMEEATGDALFRVIMRWRAGVGFSTLPVNSAPGKFNVSLFTPHA